MSEKENSRPPYDTEEGKGRKTIDDSQESGNIVTDTIGDTGNSIGQGADSVSGIKDRVENIASDPNISAGDKVVAIGVAAVETIQSVQGAIGAVTGLPGALVDKAFMAIMEKLSFLRGIACLPIVKQLDPVIGIDGHTTLLGLMPHIYLGIMFNPMDFVSCIGCSIMADIVPPAPSEDSPTSQALSIGHSIATGIVKSFGASVKIGPFIPRVTAVTKSLPIPHPPLAGPLLPAPPVHVTRGHAFLGSLFVYADNQPLTGGILHLHNDCWDVGIPPIAQVIQNAAEKLFRFNRRPAPEIELPDTPPRVGVVELYLPTGIMIPIPWNKPILVNPVPTPINPTEAVNIVISAGFAKLRECAISFISKTKLGQKMGDCDFWNKVSDKYGTGTSHPADVSEGHFYTKNKDFDIAGIIPLEFKRKYNSYSAYKGSLGTGWHHNYDMALAVDLESGEAGVRLDDGRTTAFYLPERGKSSFCRKEKLWLHHHNEGYFYVSDKKGHIYRFTDKEYNNPFNKSECRLLQSISNRNGYSIRFGYDNDGILSQITDTAGRIFIVENDGKGHIKKIISPSADKKGEPFVISSYEYDIHDRLISQTNALGDTMRFEYKGTLMTKEIWRNGIAWKISYNGNDTDAKCIEIEGTGGLFHHKLEYVSSDCTIVTNSLGAKTVYYHRKGVVVKRIDPNGAENVFRYNDFCELEWVQDALGNTSTASYDEWGNLVNKTAADGGFIQINYDNKEYPYLPTSAIDAVGGRWIWEYDKQGNLTKRTNPVKAETQFEYTDGLLSTITGALGQQTSLQFDMQGNLIETLSPDGGRNRWRYDLLGQCTYYENARGGATEYEYNLQGRITRVKLPDGNVRELKYDSMGNVVVAKDKDRFVTFTYRGVNKLASRTEKNASLFFHYDTEDQLRIVENENHEEYKFNLDKQGRVIEEIGFDGLTRKFRRDIAGRVTSVVRPGGKEIAYEYDESGRTTKVIYEDGTEENYHYRKDGLMIRAINPDADVELERDILGRVVKEICNGESVESKYDISGNRTHITSSLGADIEAEYNLMGDLVGLNSNEWSSQYTRDQFGLEIERMMSGDITTHTRRDDVGRVTEQTIGHNSRTVSEKSYLWGVNNKLLAIIDNGQETHFEYDSWGNLAKTTFADGNVEYRNPDKSGNLFESLDRMDRKYTKGGQLVKTDKWEYKYDKEGNLVRKKGKNGQTWRYEWNQAGMLAKVIRPDVAEVTFKYDALGRRIEKALRSTKTKWVWDGNIPLHEWKETHTKDYSEEKGYFYNIEKQPVITWVFEEGTFVPTAKLTEQKKLSIVTNYMGTPEVMYNESGEKTWECTLSSYGKVRNFKGEWKGDCPFRYQGQYEDAETGLYYNRFRYYSPDEGMYISQDPIKLDGGYYLYTYPRNPNLDLDRVGLKSNSAILGENLPGNPSNHDAHHIVMAGSSDPKMVSLRDQMSSFKPPIDINSEQNGIWLPRSTNDKQDGLAQTAHKGEGVHSNDYKQKIYDRLNGKNRDEFESELQKIKDELHEGTSFECVNKK